MSTFPGDKARGCPVKYTSQKIAKNLDPKHERARAGPGPFMLRAGKGQENNLDPGRQRPGTARLILKKLCELHSEKYAKAISKSEPKNQPKMTLKIGSFLTPILDAYLNACLDACLEPPTFQLLTESPFKTG